jgi:hypothetical protein
VIEETLAVATGVDLLERRPFEIGEAVLLGFGVTVFIPSSFVFYLV